MTAPRNPDDLIQAFLAEGQTDLPDRAFDAVRDEIHKTHQRVVIGPWREPRMPTFVRFAIAAAAILVAAVIGLSITRGPTVGGKDSPSPSTIPTAGSSPSAEPLVYAWPMELAPGTYRTSLAWGSDFVFTFAVPDGWESRDIGIIKNGRIAVQFYLVENLVVDQCREALQTPPVGTSPDELATALSKLVQLDEGPKPITFGDRDGIYLEYSVGPDFGCPAADFRLMKLRPSTCGQGCGGLGPPFKGVEFGDLKETNRLWILAVGRSSVVINTLWTLEATEADLAELQGVFRSVEFATPNATPPPQPVGSP